VCSLLLWLCLQSSCTQDVHSCLSNCDILKFSVEHKTLWRRDMHGGVLMAVEIDSNVQVAVVGGWVQLIAVFLYLTLQTGFLGAPPPPRTTSGVWEYGQGSAKVVHWTLSIVCLSVKLQPFGN
jgi:hypothetical protein